jgi:hypothetical protein
MFEGRENLNEEQYIPLSKLASFLIEQFMAIEGNKVINEATADDGIEKLTRNAHGLGQLDMLVKMGEFLNLNIPKK